jgi:formylglycine-generating enzyme required for sulfatase activity
LGCLAARAYVHETKHEFLASGDFDGNGKADLVVLEKKTGKYRLGYQGSDGVYTWVTVRKAGLANITGVAVGRLLTTEWDALAVGSAELNQVNVLDAHNPAVAGKPVSAQPSALGPGAMTAIDIGGEGNTPLHDLYVATIYNDPDPFVLSLLRAKNGDFEAMDDLPLKGELAQVTTIILKTGGGPLVAFLQRGETGDIFGLESWASGKPVAVASASGLPTSAAYVLGRFSGRAEPDLLVYAAGGSDLELRTLSEVSEGRYGFSPPRKHSLPGPIQQAFALPTDKGAELLVIHGEGDKAAVYSLAGASPTAVQQAIPAPLNEVLTGAFVGTGGFMLLSGPAGKTWSSRFNQYKASGSAYAEAWAGDLPTLDEVDVMIHARILGGQAASAQAEMKAYTNRIPGTAVSYAMLPIPGGEFLMGSPESEPDRSPDESPAHKVTISPFWMGRCEVTWNEFELFMYPDEERKFRVNNPTDEAGDALADVVARPTKPYTEMSFGMGKDGYPAIAMTQHAANKYCQWLSAKTGHFYRLPTEAEWEYACRAGTATAYSFGNDVSQLGNYAWYEENSDFKYHKVGTKKPNPWGLFDMHGNVLEWCLDQYETNYVKLSGEVSVDPWVKATRPYPHSARGGSYDDEKMRLRSAARRGSDRTWKMQDPQLPKSVWYFSDAPWVGFRLVRPLKVPPPEELSKYWTSGVERD